MQKILNNNVCFMAILIAMLEMTLNFSTPYSKSILPINPSNDLIWSFIIFVIFFFVLSAFAIFSFTKLTFSQHKKQIALSFFTLLIIRIILDLGCCIFRSIEARILCNLTTDCIFFIIMFHIITFAYTGKNLLKDLFIRLKANDKSIAIVSLLYALTTAISTSYLSYRFLDLLKCAEKYTLDSPFYLFQSMNYIFNSQQIRMFTAIILQTVLVITLNKLYKEKSDKNLHRGKSFIKVIARSTIAFVAIFALLLVKLCISRVGAVDKIPQRSSDSYIGLPNLVSNSFVHKQVYRVENASSQILVYENTNVKIKYHDKELVCFTLNNFFDYKYVNQEYNNIHNSNSGKSVKIQEQEIVFFSNQYIAFAVNDTPYIVSFENICKENENEILTAFIEYMLSCGYWDYFEYGCEYLLKYDPEFIKPYIERYTKGDFSDNELNLNKDIKTEYMIDFANSMEEYENFKN